MTAPLPRREPLAAWKAMAPREPEPSEFDAFAKDSAPNDRFSAERLERLRDALVVTE
ncbi:hypothetical protein [Streptomyces sp. NPDC088915]|uniref:hypothetical protein n=1 Tax=Streptomyces sp. NPDC088915 TaxID=3365912 RepID=UPI00380423CA